MGKLKNYKEQLLKDLQDPEEAAAYLEACLEDEDPHVFLLALRDITEVYGGMTKLSNGSLLSRQSLYRTLSKNGNPKLTSVCSILATLGFDLKIKPAQSKIKSRPFANSKTPRKTIKRKQKVV